MSTFGKVEHQVLSSFVPFTIKFVDMGSLPFLLRSRPWKRPMSSRESSTILSNSGTFAVQFSMVPRFLQSMSLYIDLKMTLPLNCSGSHFNSEIIVFCISSRIPNVVNPGKFLHSISIGTPSIPSKSLTKRVSKNHLILLFYAWTGSVLIPPRHSTESQKTQVLAVAN